MHVSLRRRAHGHGPAQHVRTNLGPRGSRAGIPAVQTCARFSAGAAPAGCLLYTSDAADDM
eukprot:5015639-Alexandrium_andersonii.AAC.1